MENILVTLGRVFCIYYLIWFKKDKIKALIDLRSKVNTMISVFAVKLGLKICFINVGA